MAELDWYLQVNLKARHLRLLVAIDTYRNLTQVADVTHVTVPAVSKSLAELERGLGLELFTRTQQGLKPTQHGECLIRHARSILTDLNTARDELKALSSGAEGKISVGVLPASTYALMPRAVALLKSRSPKTNVLVTEAPSAILLPDLWQGKLDLVVGRLPATSVSGSFKEKELYDEPVLLMTGPQHPLASRRKLAWADLAAYPWILPPPGSILRDPLERVLAANNVALASNYIETFSPHFARSYLHISNAIAVLASSIANEDTLRALPLALPRMLRPAGVLWNANRELSPGARTMLTCLEEAGQHLAAGVGRARRPGPAP
jgi:DNA-binding transcriptional LysR family regulator